MVVLAAAAMAAGAMAGTSVLVQSSQPLDSVPENYLGMTTDWWLDDPGAP